MNADEDRAVSRLRSCLQSVLSSRAPVSEVYTWCQDAFPGSCYLSCAILVSANNFATTSNLLERSPFEVTIVPGQHAPLQLPSDGMVLHSSWPQRHPDLQLLLRNHRWESVILVPVSSVDSSAAAPDSGPQLGGQADHAVASEQQLNREAAGSLPNGNIREHQQSDQAEVDKEGVVALGLRGQTHDLERILVRLQALAYQLAPVLHGQRQQLIDQALHAANTDANASAAGMIGHSHADPASAAALEDGAAATAAAAEAQAASASNDGTQATVVTPFATAEGLALPSIALASPPAGPDRPGRRQEQSGSLPLEQMLSRNPSPIGSIPSQSSLSALDRHYSDSLISRQSSTQPSRLGSVPEPFRDDAHGRSSNSSQLDAAAASAVASAAAAALASGIPPPPPRPLATVYSGQGLPSDNRKVSFDQELTVPADEGQEAAEQAADSAASAASHDFDFGMGKEKTSCDSSCSRKPAGAARLAEGKSAEQHRQHPWLLYFYDSDLEKDYSKYHAQHMAKVDTISMIICVVIYLHLGFASSHGYAFRVPLTFGVSLTIMLAILFTVLCQHNRWLSHREWVLRLGAWLYLALAAFSAFPAVLRSVPPEKLQEWAFVARYSNTSTLATSALAAMVRLHIHLPCQLINFAMSAALLPSTICKAGFPQYTLWKCTSTGIAAQFFIGVVLSSFVVALNERRLRGMYLRSLRSMEPARAKAKTN